MTAVDSSVAAELSSPVPSGPSVGAASRGRGLSSVLSLPVADFALFASTASAGTMAAVQGPESAVCDQSDSSLSSPDLKCTLLGYDVTEPTARVRLLGAGSDGGGSAGMVSASGAGACPSASPSAGVQSGGGSTNWLDLNVEVRKMDHGESSCSDWLVDGMMEVGAAGGHALFPEATPTGPCSSSSSSNCSSSSSSSSSSNSSCSSSTASTPAAGMATLLKNDLHLHHALQQQQVHGGQPAQHHIQQHHHVGLDVLLGNPNLHNSSGADLLDGADAGADFPLTPQLLLNGNNSNSSSCCSSGAGIGKKKRNKSGSGSPTPCAAANGMMAAGQPTIPTASAPGSASVPLASGSSTAAGIGQQMSPTSANRQPLQPPQPCSMCTKVFTSTSALAKHRLTHSDERRFSCQLCGKAFKRQDHLNGHLITHREKKPFECQVEGCGKSYCDARSLRRHQDNHHAGSSANSGASGPPGSSSSSAVGAAAAPPILEQLHSPSAEVASAQSAAVHLFSDLSCGAGDLLGLSYPASSSSSGFVQASPEYSSAGAGVDSSAWASAAVDASGLDPFGQSSPSCGLTNGYHLSSAADDGSFQALVTDASAVGWTDPCVQDVVGSISSGHAESIQRPAKGKGEKGGKSARKVGPSAPASGVKSKKAKAQKNSGNSGHHLMTTTVAGSVGSKLKSDTNDGLTSQQLELIQEIMRQTQEQHRLLQEEQQQKTHPKPPQPPQPPVAAAPAAAGSVVKSKKSVKGKWTGGSASAMANAAANNNASVPAEPSASATGCSSLAADCGRPVECNVCQRRFKNTPALNGHMRLHGGFLKKDSECKKPDKKDPNTPPLQTASVSIRALIEEKIIQRRNLNACGSGTQSGGSGGNASGGMNSSAASGEDDARIDGLTTPTNQQPDLTDGTESNPGGCKLEPESYFEGSLLALSPVSLHRALEGDADDHLTGSDGSGHQHPHDFFSTSSSSSASSAAAAVAAAELNDVPLLDDAVFHQVSAAAASALLSDISSLDLQSYMDAGGSHGADGYSECLSQYLATTAGPATPAGSNAAANSGAGSLFGETHYGQQAQQQQAQQQADGADLSFYGGYNAPGDQQTSGQSNPPQQSADVQRFSFDPSPLPSTPLSSLCSPQYIDGFPTACPSVYSDAGQYDSVPHGSTSSGGLLLPTPSPYTPSPSPVSPAVVGSHLHRFQPQHPQPQQQQHPQQQQASNYFSNGSGFPEMHPPTNNFMIECANTVLYNMESGLSSGWDTAAAAFVDAHALDLNSIQQTLPPPQYQPQAQPSQAAVPADLKPLKVKSRMNKSRSASVSSGGEASGKKSRTSRAKKWSSASGDDEPDAKIRRSASAQRSSRLRDELDELLSDGIGKFSSLMRPESAGSSQHYVAPPMLDPRRCGSGLHWNLVKDGAGSAFQSPPAAPQRGRINVGKEFQCAALPRFKKDASAYKEKEAATLRWNGHLDTNQEATGHLLAWNQSANVPGPKRSQEDVLEVLCRFRGDVQAAKLHLFQQATTTDGADSDRWTADEMALFHAALLEHGKDFNRVAQRFPLKTAAQCVQFYYSWKKLCHADYQVLKQQCRQRRNNSNNCGNSSAPHFRDASALLADDVGLCDWSRAACPGDGSALTSPIHPPHGLPAASSSLPCEFADCPAISTSRTGRRGARRGAADRTEADAQRISPSPCSTPRPPSATNGVETTAAPSDKLYPCSVCNKIFDKVKSRSAHMKTHKSASSCSSSSRTKCRGQQQHIRKALALSPCSSLSSSASSSLPSPFLPSQSIF